MQLNSRFHFGSIGSDLRVGPFFLLLCEERRDREIREYREFKEVRAIGTNGIDGIDRDR